MKLNAFVPVSSTDVARAFYVDVLGLVVDHEHELATVVRSGDTKVRLTRTEGFTPQPFTVLGWEVDDIVDAVAWLGAAGVALVRYDGMAQDEAGIWTAPGGDRVAWFRDPDGNLLSLDQPA